jgi:hypothetical protein
MAVAVLIATAAGDVPTGIEVIDGADEGAGCTARLTPLMDPLGEPVPQLAAPIVGHDTVLVTVMGYRPGLATETLNCNCLSELNATPGSCVPLNCTFTTGLPMKPNVVFVVPK